jgi:ferritin-like metal-binding protein YciE
MSSNENDSFYNLFITELKDLFSAENQLVDSFPSILSAASTPDLRECIQHHFEQTKNQISRLNKIFDLLKVESTGVHCEAIKGLIEEVNNRIRNFPSSAVRDAALIAAMQRIEHYEIAQYGTAKTFAKQLGFNNVSDLLENTLKEEREADSKLTKIAEGGFFTSGVNKRAAKLHK